jgi:hypothetical protein
MIDNFLISIAYLNKSGHIEREGESYPITEFGGTVPQVGDRILNPGATMRTRDEKINFSDPDRREFWLVKERIFITSDTHPNCILLCESLPATMRESNIL